MFSLSPHLLILEIVQGGQCRSGAIWKVREFMILMSMSENSKFDESFLLNQYFSEKKIFDSGFLWRVTFSTYGTEVE